MKKLLLKLTSLLRGRSKGRIQNARDVEVFRAYLQRQNYSESKQRYEDLLQSDAFKSICSEHPGYIQVGWNTVFVPHEDSAGYCYFSGAALPDLAEDAPPVEYQDEVPVAYKPAII